MPKLLIVEDNEMNRDMLSRRLTRKGYEVVMAVDGAEGVAMAASEAPDLILMDMSLPVMNGWDATRALKMAERTRSIPVIALTALAMVGDREQALAAGCDDYDTSRSSYPGCSRKFRRCSIAWRNHRELGRFSMSQNATDKNPQWAQVDAHLY